MHVPEMELQFITECKKHENVREKYFNTFDASITFPYGSNCLSYFQSADYRTLAACHVTTCHRLGDGG